MGWVSLPFYFLARLAWVFLILRGIRECSHITAALYSKAFQELLVLQERLNFCLTLCFVHTLEQDESQSKKSNKTHDA